MSGPNGTPPAEHPLIETTPKSPEVRLVLSPSGQFQWTTSADVATTLLMLELGKFHVLKALTEPRVVTPR